MAACLADIWHLADDGDGESLAMTHCRQNEHRSAAGEAPHATAPAWKDPVRSLGVAMHAVAEHRDRLVCSQTSTECARSAGEGQEGHHPVPPVWEGCPPELVWYEPEKNVEGTRML